MPAHTLNGIGSACRLPSRPADAALWLAALLLAAGMLGGAARGQASESASGASASAAQAAQQGSKAAPAAQPSSGPMVMGDNPDSIQDAAPAPPAEQAAQPAAQPAQSAPAVWPPAHPLGEAPALQPAAAAAAPKAALPVAAPANAGGDAARQQINDACVNLLKMANELKAAVDKTNKDMLSVAVVRKAGEIETLAHQVKDEMRPEVGKN